MSQELNKYHQIGETVRIKARENMSDYWHLDNPDEHEVDFYSEIYSDYEGMIFVVEMKRGEPACVRYHDTGGHELGWMPALLSEFEVTAHLDYEDVQSGVI